MINLENTTGQFCSLVRGNKHLLKTLHALEGLTYYEGRGPPLLPLPFYSEQPQNHDCRTLRPSRIKSPETKSNKNSQIPSIFKETARSNPCGFMNGNVV